MSFYLKKYMWLISLVAVIFCSYFLARMTAGLIALKLEEGVMLPAIKPEVAQAPKEGEDKPMDLEAYQPILERNIFDSRDTGQHSSEIPPTIEEETGIITGEAVPTNLKIKLISTFSVGDGTDPQSSAVISTSDSKQGREVYIVNDEKKFAPDTKIVKILYDRVEFINKGRLEYVLLEDFTKGMTSSTSARAETPVKGKEEATPSKIEETSAGKYVIDRAEIDAAIANLDKLYTEVRAVPHFKEGNPDGLKLLSVRSGSIFSKLGLQRGDIIKRINGTELDIKKGLELFNQLKNETRIGIDIERRGSPQTMDYEIR